MIEVMYSCKKCGLKNVKVMVVARSPKENVIEFVQRAALQCVADHDNKSVSCELEGKLDDLYIPVPGEGQPVGSELTKQ